MTTSKAHHIRRGIACVALALLAGPAGAQVTSTITLSSEYGFRGKFNDDAGYDVGVVWYSWDFNNFNKTAAYVEGNVAVPLPNDFGLALHAGYSDGDYWDVTSGGGYLDYSIGVTRTLGKWALALTMGRRQRPQGIGRDAG